MGQFGPMLSDSYGFILADKKTSNEIIKSHSMCQHYKFLRTEMGQLLCNCYKSFCSRACFYIYEYNTLSLLLLNVAKFKWAMIKYHVWFKARTWFKVKCKILLMVVILSLMRYILHFEHSFKMDSQDLAFENPALHDYFIRWKCVQLSKRKQATKALFKVFSSRLKWS